MAELKLKVEKLDDVDEALRPLYVEKDGAFILNVEGVSTLESEVARMRKSLKDVNKEAEAERTRRKAWEKFGKTPEEIEEMLGEYDKLSALKEQHEMTEAEKKGQWEALKQQLLDKQKDELGKKEKLILEAQENTGKLRKSIEKHLINSVATAAIVEHKGEPLFLLNHVREHLQVEEEDGNFNIKVVDDKGEPRINGKGDPLTVSEFVGEMKTNEKFGRAFEGSGTAGGGTRPNNGGGSTGHPSITRRTDLKTERDRAQYIEKYGLETYAALPL